MTELEKSIIQTLIGDGVLTKNSVQEIAEKMEIGLTLGEVLIGDNYVTQEGLATLLVDFYKRGKVFLKDINEVFLIDTKIFLEQLALKCKYEFFDIDSIEVDYRLSEKVAFATLKKFGAFPIKEDDINVYVAFKNPFDIGSQDKIQQVFNRKLMKICVAVPEQIDKYIAKTELTESVRGIISEIRKELANTGNGGQQNSDSSGILQLIDMILKTCINSKASDIHIEPTETNCIVRGRIDGMLAEIFIFDKDIYPPLLSRLKLLANLDIAEKRKPQDGRFSSIVNGREYDFRFSTLPIMTGESIVIRILDKSKIQIELAKLGFHPRNFDRFIKAMHSPYGIILVTGPTGSGKTTTLYAALNDIKDIKTKIITVEDPVEYQLGMVQQVQVNEQAGLTFAAALRSILRQDPDIIMIGEIRDQETLRIAIQAALTGHLVFSTLHTNDAISSVSRMVDMGIEPYLISGSVVAIEAQRLIRRLCKHCKEPTNLPKNIMEQISQYLPEKYQFYKAVGCDHCSNTGYSGRESISEVLSISDRLTSLIAAGALKDELAKVAYEEGFIDMFHDGVIRAANGSTSMDEIFRVAKE